MTAACIILSKYIRESIRIIYGVTLLTRSPADIAAPSRFWLGDSLA